MSKEVRYDSAFVKFSEFMQPQSNSVEESLLKIQKAVAAIADTFQIGKMTIDLEAPSSPLAPEGVHGIEDIYDWNGACGDNPFVLEIETGEKGIAHSNFYPREGIEWDEDTKTFFRLVGFYAMADAGSCRKGELLRKSFITDLQTGISNLNGYMKVGQELFDRGVLGDYCSFYFNIRNFRYVNTSIGYVNGTAVLTAYAKKLQNFIVTGEVVSRLGGDNFVALIKKDRMNEFLSLIQGMRISVEHEGKPRNFAFSAVCGIYQIPDNIQYVAELMMASSMAFQNAKNSQQKVAFFSPEMLQNSMHEKSVLMKFPQALENGEFIEYYQPKINLKNNTIIGAEVLARWKEDDEIHAPSYFIPALETDGAICKLDFYMLGCACTKIRSWLDAGETPIELSVNFSRWHLKNPNFVDEIFAILDKYDVPGKYIEIEVTETVNNEDFESLLGAIKKMKERGISVSIDDFGTGYSSLTMLRQIPADILKMDKSFLSDNIQERDKRMLDHIVGMAKDLSMQVLAEGVENCSQRDYLTSIGCDAVQGFLFDKPLPEEEFDKRIAGHQKYGI